MCNFYVAKPQVLLIVHGLWTPFMIGGKNTFWLEGRENKNVLLFSSPTHQVHRPSEVQPMTLRVRDTDPENQS